MSFIRYFLMAGAAIAALCSVVWAEDTDRLLRPYAVHVVRVPKENWTGNGVYLGTGLVLTAGHVAGEFWRTVQVEIAGKMLPTQVLKRGRLSGVDLALLGIDDGVVPMSLRLRRMTVCVTPPWPGEGVVVTTPEGLARSHVVSPAVLPANLAPRFRTAIADVSTTGNSGSGVFDIRQQCLLGIISAKIQGTETRLTNGRIVQRTRDVAKYFVPAPEIIAFLPPEMAKAYSDARPPMSQLTRFLAPTWSEQDSGGHF